MDWVSDFFVCKNRFSNGYHSIYATRVQIVTQLFTITLLNSNLIFPSLSLLWAYNNLFPGQPRRPPAANANVAAAAANQENQQAVYRRPIIQATGNGSLGFMVGVERVLYGFIASLIPSWDPENFAAAPALGRDDEANALPPEHENNAEVH